MASQKLKERKRFKMITKLNALTAGPAKRDKGIFRRNIKITILKLYGHNKLFIEGFKLCNKDINFNNSFKLRWVGKLPEKPLLGLAICVHLNKSSHLSLWLYSSQFQFGKIFLRSPHKANNTNPM